MSSSTYGGQASQGAAQAGTYQVGSATVHNNGDASGGYTDDAHGISIQVHGDGSGSYTDATSQINLYGDGGGSYHTAGGESIVISAVHDGTYARGESYQIRNNGDGSGMFIDGDLTISNYGDGTGLVSKGRQNYDVQVEPLAPVALVGTFPSLGALTPTNVCGVLVTVETEVLFDFGSAAVRPESAAPLADVATALTRIEAPAVEAIGHTDSVGDEASNQSLSEQRAQAVREVLVGQGYTGHVTASGRGESQPIAPNENPDGSDNAAGRQLNRRVEVFVPVF